MSPRSRSPLERGYAWHLARRSYIRHRLGYRGLVLFLLGFIYVFIGLSVIGANDYRPELVHTHLPILVRIGIWVIPGIVAMVVAFDDKWKALGFALLFIPPAERAVSYFVAAVTVPTFTRIPAVLIYLLLLVMISTIASWPEPAEIQKDIYRQDNGTLTDEDRQKYLDGEGTLHDPKNGDT